MSGETFTKWWRRNRDRIGKGRPSVEEAAAEVQPLRLPVVDVTPGRLLIGGEEHPVGSRAMTLEEAETLGLVKVIQ